MFNVLDDDALDAHVHTPPSGWDFFLIEIGYRHGRLPATARIKSKEKANIISIKSVYRAKVAFVVNKSNK